MAAPDTPRTPAVTQPRKATIASMLASPRGLWRFLRDPQSPIASKLLAAFTVLYVVSPVDVIPDWLVPVLGWCDDVGVTAAALAYVAAQAARYANEQSAIGVRPAPRGEPVEKPSAG